MVIPLVTGSQLPGNLSRRRQEAQNQETAASAASQDPNALQKSMSLRSSPRRVLPLGVRIKTDLSALSTAEEPIEESALAWPVIGESGEEGSGFSSGSSQTELAADLKALLFALRAADTGAATKAAAAASKLAAAAQDEIQSVESGKDRDRSRREGSNSSDVEQPSSPGGSGDSGSNSAPASTRIAAVKPLGMETTQAMIIDSFISNHNSMAA
jgi:hypothetical protein